MTSIVLGGNTFSRVIDTSFTESNEIFEPEYLNQDTVTLDSNVWTKSPLIVTYTMRCTSAEKWILDQKLIAHLITSLVDTKYDLDDDIWIENVEVEWKGNENWALPWLYTVKLIIIR